MRLLRLRDVLVLAGLLALLLVVFGASTAQAGSRYRARYAYTAGYYPATYDVAVMYRRVPSVNYRLRPNIYAPHYVPLPVVPLPATRLPAVYYW